MNMIKYVSIAAIIYKVNWLSIMSSLVGEWGVGVTHEALTLQMVL